MLTQETSPYAPKGGSHEDAVRAGTARSCNSGVTGRKDAEEPSDGEDEPLCLLLHLSYERDGEGVKYGGCDSGVGLW